MDERCCSRTLLAHARNLRQHQTEAEQRLWYHLRARRFLGLKFRRQVPLGPYIVDFLCPALKLVIEADGGQHGAAADGCRDQWLRDRGYLVLRFWNHKILQDTEAVLEAVRVAVEELGR